LKIWTGYGSEHSYRLVMIGHFADETAAAVTKEKFDKLTEHVAAQLNAGTMDIGWDSDERMSDALRDALAELGLYNLGVSEVSNFAYEFDTELRGDSITLTTDEGEVQGFLKVMLDGGARIEVFSGHNWTEAGEPRQAGE
jgi:hypothetical protein